MKKILFLAITFIAIQSEAKVWRVNNNPSLDGDVLQATTLFDNVNTATNPEAAAGDSVYFEPSPTQYSGVSANKTNITFMGLGYFLTENPGLQAMSNARVSYIEFLITAAGSKAYGLDVTTVYMSSNNDTLSRCIVQTVYAGYNVNVNLSGLRIDKCYITSQVTESSLGAAVTSVNVSIENCIISAISSTGAVSGISLGQKVRGLLRNNTFNYCLNIHCYNFYIANNIIVYQANMGNVTQSGNNIYRNNLFSFPQANYNTQNLNVNNTLPNSGNQFAINMANVFVGTPDNVYNAGNNTYNNYITHIATGAIQEGRFELDPTGNPALGAGENGTTYSGAIVTGPNYGAFGATDPYRKAGLPPIPSIYSLTVPATVPNGASTMNISISSRSNN